MVQKDRIVYQERLADSFRRNPKAVFRHMARYASTRSGIPGMLTERGLTTTNWEAAQALTKPFAQGTPQRRTSALDCCFSDGSLTTTTISLEMVCAELKRLKTMTSPGSDGIPARVLKHCAEVLVTPLSMLFNRSLVDSRVLVGWKLATITPIFKKVDRTDPGNYRPVALLPIIFKVMECALDNLIRQYLFERQLKSLHQHGFVRGRRA